MKAKIRQTTAALAMCVMVGALMGALAGAATAAAPASATGNGPQAHPAAGAGARPEAGAASQPDQQMPLSVLLEKAIYTEQTVGDVDGAMALYRQVIEQAQANRPYVAQAYYRLAMCHIAKDQRTEAMGLLNKLIADFPEQQDLVAQGRKQLEQARAGISDAEVKAIVTSAVKAVSTMVESDPKLPAQISKVSDVKDAAVVRELAGWLDSEVNNQRRAAIYLLWMADLDDVSEGFPKLRELLSHEENLTRGMAGIALGARKDTASLDKMIDLTLNDPDGYARRAVAYGLGLMGDRRAVPALQKALKDPDKMVANNAQAALAMLEATPATGPGGAAQVTGELRAEVMGYIIGEHVKTLMEAGQKGLYPNAHVYGVANGQMCVGGFIPFRHQGVQPLTGEVNLGNVSYDDLVFFDETGRTAAITLQDRGADARGGRYQAMWNPGRPIQPGEQRLFGWRRTTLKPLERKGDGYALQMRNKLGAPGLESFYLVLMGGQKVMEQPRPADAVAQVAGMAIHRWTDQVPANTNHVVEVVVSAQTDGDNRADPAEARQVGEQLLSALRENQVERAFALATAEYRADHPNSFAELANRMDLSAAKVDQALASGQSACVVLSGLANKADGKLMSMGLGLERQGNRFLIRDVDALPNAKAVGEFTEGFKRSLYEAQPVRQADVDPVYARQAEELSTEGWRLWNQRKLAEAEGKFKTAVMLDPTNANAWNGLGWSQFNQGKPLNATESFEKAVAIDSSLPGALNGLGWVAKQQGRVDEAIGCWEKAIAVAPTATAAYNGLATTYLEQGRYDRAIHYYAAWYLVADLPDMEAEKGLKQAMLKSKPQVYASLDLSSPEAAVRSFTQATAAGDVERAMAAVMPYGHDYEDIREGLSTPDDPIRQVLAAVDAEAPIEITDLKPTHNAATIAWKVTMKSDVSVGEGPKSLRLKKGDTFKLDATLVKIDDWWLIRGM